MSKKFKRKTQITHWKHWQDKFHEAEVSCTVMRRFIDDCPCHCFKLTFKERIKSWWFKLLKKDAPFRQQCARCSALNSHQSGIMFLTDHKQMKDERDGLLAVVKQQNQRYQRLQSDAALTAITHHVAP